MLPARLPRWGRTAIAYAHDIFMAAASFVLSLLLRLGDALYVYSPELLIQGTALFTVVSAVVFRFMGLYRGVWRYASLNDLLAITRSTTLAVLIFLSVMFLWTRLEELPRSLLIVNWFVLVTLLGGPRFLYRLIKDRRFEWSVDADGRLRIPVLLVGSEDGAELFIRELSRSGDANYRIAGIVSERESHVGQRIHGVEVLGTVDDIPAVVAAIGGRGDRPQRLILTRDDMDGARVRALLDTAGELGMTLARLPKLTDFKSGITDKVDVRPIAIEDLLGRPQTALDRPAMERLIARRRVLVTGAGGSIGGELVRQISDIAPAELVLLDNSEYNLYAIELELANRHPELSRRAVFGDVRNRCRMDKVFADVAPELVFHAAALKHVPLVESNVFEGVMTNVIGTVNVADACRRTNAAVMVMISTDKAVNPSSVMGATKRIAETYCQSLDVGRGLDDGTRFITVRFGNVLGSTGSVVPLFQKQLARGGPLTVTHPEMRRYFMTVRESVGTDPPGLGPGKPEYRARGQDLRPRNGGAGADSRSCPAGHPPRRPATRHRRQDRDGRSAPRREVGRGNLPRRRAPGPHRVQGDPAGGAAHCGRRRAQALHSGTGRRRRNVRCRVGQGPDQGFGPRIQPLDARGCEGGCRLTPGATSTPSVR